MMATMLRLTDTRGWRSWPASFHAERYALIWAACWMWKGSPVSLFLSVELCRFMPSFAAHIAVAFEPAPHQMRSRSPGECGSRASNPGGLETSDADWAARNRCRAARRERPVYG